MIVDFCAYLGSWPPYPLSHDDASGLLALMDRCGIEHAFVSALEGALAYNAGETNDLLAQRVEAHRRRLRPVGTLNPALPIWRHDLAAAALDRGIAGFRLQPAYHGYDLGGSPAGEAARAVGEMGLPLFVASFLDEERFQHPALRVPALTVASLAALVRSAPATTIVINNLAPEDALALCESGAPLEHVWLDIGNMDKPASGLAEVAARFGTSRLLFGSQAPFLYPEAILTLALTAELGAGVAGQILEENWRASPVLGSAVLGSAVLGSAG
jgi:predicted TIM-barrel fold metal-dependent hydrolase